MRPLILLLAATSILSADALDDLRTALRGLKASLPVTLKLEREHRESGKDGNQPVRKTLVVRDGPQGMQILQGEESGKDTLGKGGAKDMVRAHESLLKQLEDARLLEARPDSFEGRPAQRLRLALKGEEDAEARKHLSRFVLETTIWMGEDHLPLAMELNVDLKGRVMLVMSFWTQAQERRRFLKVQDRLVVAEEHSQAKGKVMGKAIDQQGSLKTTVL